MMLTATNMFGRFGRSCGPAIAQPNAWGGSMQRAERILIFVFHATSRPPRIAGGGSFQC